MPFTVTIHNWDVVSKILMFLDVQWYLLQWICMGLRWTDVHLLVFQCVIEGNQLMKGKTNDEPLLSSWFSKKKKNVARIVLYFHANYFIIIMNSKETTYYILHLFETSFQIIMLE